MFSFAFLIGIYSYLIFLLGLSGFLYKQNIVILTFIYCLILCIYYKNCLYYLTEKLKDLKPVSILFARKLITDKISLVVMLLLLLQVFINLIGALGPETAFDALWYHLTLPKLYLLNHAIRFVPGGLLYYSEMPRLTEMFYVAALAFSSEILAKIIHFSFGILSTIVLYKLSREFFSKKISLIASLIFYSNLVISWESITAYIDLARAFFEIMALWGFMNWVKSRKRQWLIESGALLGLAIATKTLALGSAFVITVLIFFVSIRSTYEQTSFRSQDPGQARMTKRGELVIKNISLFLFFVIIASIPWFVDAFVNTGNPFYPLFTNYNTHQTLGMVINPLRFVSSFWTLFTHSPDPLSPVYIMFFPLLVYQAIQVKSLYKKTAKNPWIILAFYSILSFVIWYITPQSGGGRFIIPYLPALSIISVSVLTFSYPKWFKTILLSVIIFVATITIVYRGVANARYVPVILGKESKSDFLAKHLNFNFGDFYDIDGYFAKHVKSTDRVLTYGMHNLYYIDFSFIDSSWAKNGDKFNYILVQNGDLPKRFSFWRLVYTNKITHVKLYTLDGQIWYY